MSNATLSLNLADFDDISDSTDDPKGSRLLGTIEINGVSFHAEALELVEKDDEQRVTAEGMADSYDALYNGTGSDGYLQTIEHDGRQYALFIYPFSG